MRFILLFAFLLFNSSVQAQTFLPDKSRQQADEYIQNIIRSKNPAINLWALNEVTKNGSGIQSYIANKLSKINFSSSALLLFQDTTLNYNDRLRKIAFDQETPLLLVAYLINEKNRSIRKKIFNQYVNEIGFSSSDPVPYRKLIQAILDNKPITTGILPADQFYPVHFLLLFNNDLVYGDAISSSYLETAVQNWDNPGLLRTETLSQSLYRASLFRIHYILYQNAETQQLYRPIIQDPHFPVSLLQLNIFRMLDYSMYRLGYYNRSLNIIREYSLPLARYLDQKETELKLRIAQGSYLYYIGKIEASKKVYDNAQTQAQKQNIPYSKGYVFNNQAVNYWKSGEFDRYLDLEFQALEAAQNEKNYNLHFDILKNLFTHYRTSENFDAAQRYLLAAKELAQKKEDTESLARLSYLEGLLYQDSKASYRQAIASFDKALSFINKENYYTSYQDILTAKGKILEKQSRYSDALELYNQMLQIARERQDPRNNLFASYSIANTYLTIQQVDSAAVILDTLNSKNLDALDFYQLVKARTVQARFHAQSGDPEQGADVLKPVINQIVKRSRSSGDLETGFWQVEPEYLHAFETYANLLISNGHKEQAVEVLDLLKTINDAALYQNPLVRSKVLNEEELSRYKRLTDDLDALRKQLLTAAGEQQISLQQQIDEKSAEKNALDRKITANANPDPVPVNYIQRRMSARERVLHITELNDTYYIATISRTGVSFNKIRLTAQIRALFEATIREMAAGNTDLEKLHSIYDFLEIQALPDHVKKLTIIPDSYLYQFPLDILPLTEPAYSKSYGDATYLIEEYQTSYMTSLNDFKDPADTEAHRYSYTGFGVSKFDGARKNLVPLPKAKTEIIKITNQLSALENKKTFINDEATEEAFREAAPDARVVHMATHSEVSAQDPMFSSIYLNRGTETENEKFPGRIFAYELFELNLNNELIMLNSCESGSGSYLQGTGVVGLSRALRYAGAQSLILNIWSVNDMLASEFAVHFYKAINDGDTKSEALRKAKLYFLKTKNANPHYWGSYMLLGNETAIVHPNRFTKQVAAASFVIFFFLLAIASSVVEVLKRRRVATRK